MYFFLIHYLLAVDLLDLLPRSLDLCKCNLDFVMLYMKLYRSTEIQVWVFVLFFAHLILPFYNNCVKLDKQNYLFCSVMLGQQ